MKRCDWRVDAVKAKRYVESFVSYRLATETAKATFGVPMADYRWLSADRMVQESEFENGVVATVNFGKRPFVMADGTVLPPGGHRLVKRKIATEK